MCSGNKSQRDGTSNMPFSLSCVVARRTSLALAPLLVDLRNWSVGGDGLAGALLVDVKTCTSSVGVGW